MRKTFWMTAAVVLTLGACSTSEEAILDSSSGVSGDRETISSGPLADVYQEGLDGTSRGTQADLVVNVGDRVFYGYDRYDLSDEARATLENQARWLEQYPSLSVTVEGHADERGTREYNLALGDRRANAARNYLIALGIDAARVATISFGKERPAVPGSNDTAWAQNRRGVTKVD